VDTSFGQPVGAICQIAFTVPDLRSAIPVYADRLHAGPWLLMEHFRPATQRYRREPTTQDVSLALAYTGSMMVELIELTPEVDAHFGAIKALSEHWDGTDLIHRP
jgi:hypothetical protein